MKRLWNSFKIAFSMYSKIPMPNSDWTKENMRYAMVFFPWVGLIIGALSCGWVWLWEIFSRYQIEFSDAFKTIILLLIPVCVTGGIHLDGLLDTADACSSWQEKERRLEILKDSHAGAFAIITCVVYFLLYYGAYTMVDKGNILVIGLGFVLSRTFSALSIVTFPMAKGTGLAATFSEGADKKPVRNIIAIYLIGLIFLMVILGGWIGIAAVIAATVVFIHYRCMSVKLFGGITGDLAGYFLQICELAMAIAIVFASAVLG